MDDYNQLYECPICYIKNNFTTKTTECNHKFHASCIDSWLIDHNTCPMCRKVNPFGMINQDPTRTLHVRMESIFSIVVLHRD